ncbi:MAG TPA: hypothetical protein PLB21_04605, partial [Actinomycetota bacterium]|nr:hypothetical protein [Actinomycetota bacterium]
MARSSSPIGPLVNRSGRRPGVFDDARACYDSLGEAAAADAEAVASGAPAAVHAAWNSFAA